MKIIIENYLVLSISEIQEHKDCNALLKSIQKLFTYKNPKFIDNEKYGYSNYNVPKHLTSYSILDGKLLVNRGGLEKILKQLSKFNILPNIVDNTLLCDEVSFEQSNTVLRSDQKQILDKIINHDNGLYQCYCSFGKTVLSLELIRHFKQPAMVLVHTTFLMEQWIKEATDKKLFNLDIRDIGGVGGLFAGNKRRYGKLNICLYHSMSKKEHFDFFKDRIGILVHDEVQKSPIDAVQMVVNPLKAKYKFGTSAEITRKDGKQFLTFDTFGPLRAVAAEKNSASKISAEINLVISNTRDEQYSEDGNYSGLITRMSRDRERNILICRRAVGQAKRGNLVLILVERKAQAAILAKMLSKFRVDMLLGGNVSSSALMEMPQGAARILKAYNGKTAYSRIEKLCKYKKLDFVIGTQKAEVGLSVRAFNHLIITTPMGKNYERFKQAKGRIERTYSDEQVDYFGCKKPIPTVDVIVDKYIRPSMEAGEVIKEIWGDSVKKVKHRTKIRGNE